MTEAGTTGDLPTPRARSYVLFVFFCLTALNVMDRQVLAILIEPIKAEMAVSDTAMGLLSGSAFALFHAVAAVPIARWADRGNRRTIIALGLFVWSGLTAATGLARSFGQIFVARIGVGIGETVGSGPAQSLLSDTFPPERRGTALSIHGAGGIAGAMIGFALGGWLGETYGWRATFVAFGLPGLLLALLLRFSVAEPRRGRFDGPGAGEFDGRDGRDGRDAADAESGDDGVESIPDALRFLASLSSLRHVYVAVALSAFANYGLLTWAAAFLMRVHGLGQGDAGLALAFGLSLPTFVGVITSGAIADRLGRRNVSAYTRLPAVASLLVPPLAAGALLAPDFSVAMAFLAPAAFFNTMWLGPTNAVIQGLAKPRMRAFASAINILFNSAIGLGLGPLFVGALSDGLTPRFGDHAIRYALLAGTLPQAWAALHLWLASKTLADDMRAKERSTPRPAPVCGSDEPGQED